MKLELTDGSGRLVRVCSLALEETYGGALEGSPSRLSELFTRQAREWEQEEPHRQVIQASSPLPAWRATAYLQSRATSPGKDEAGLEVTFWLELTGATHLAEVFAGVLATVDWSRAREWEFDDW